MNRFKRQRQECVDLSYEELGERGKEMDAKRLLKNGNQCRIIACGSCRRHPRHRCPVHRVDLDRLFIRDRPPRKSIRSIPMICLVVGSAQTVRQDKHVPRPPAQCLFSQSSLNLLQSMFNCCATWTEIRALTMTSYNSGKPCHLGTRRTAWASHKNTAMPNEALSVTTPAIRVGDLRGLIF